MRIKNAFRNSFFSIISQIILIVVGFFSQRVMNLRLGEELVGMICAMDDGIMNAYVHYLLVDPNYHGKTIGRTLVNMVKEKYKEYMRIVVVAYNDELYFYEACGFEKSNNASPMFITSLWT